EAAAAAPEAASAALEAAPAAAEAAASGAGAAAGAGIGAGAGAAAGAGAGAGSSFLPQAARAAAAISVARTSDFFISGFLFGDGTSEIRCVLVVDAASDRVDGVEPITSSAKYYSRKDFFLGVSGRAGTLKVPAWWPRTQ